MRIEPLFFYVVIFIIEILVVFYNKIKVIDNELYKKADENRAFFFEIELFYIYYYFKQNAFRIIF